MTKAQRCLLAKFAEGNATARPSGQAVKALRVAGYIEWDDSAGNGEWWVNITDAGRAALALDFCASGGGGR